MSSSNFFVFYDGGIVGPYTVADIKAWNPPPDTQVCREGTEEWVLLGQVPELLPPPDIASIRPAPPKIDGHADPSSERKKLFILHGRGNTMDNAFRLLIQLARVKLRFHHGNYYVDADNSNFVRYLAYDSHTNPYTILFDRIICGKLALSPFFPPPVEWTPDSTWTKLSEFKVTNKFETYAAPSAVTGAGKKKWCDEFFQAIWSDAASLFGVQVTSQPALHEALIAMRESLRPPEGGLYLESEYKAAIRSMLSSRSIEPEPFIAMLIEFQRLNDAGGDLDTIASNALYGAWLWQYFEKNYGRPPRYGKDFEFDFVNYHQSFMHLTRYSNTDIYLPDFPMEAIPDLKAAALALREIGSRFVRIDDHHPLGQEQIDLLNEMKAEGLVGDWFMSGPVKGGEEQGEHDRTCGADLVYRAMLAGTEFDSPGLEELCRLAHQQDLHLIENPDDREHPDYLAIDVSKLIGSKYSRIDMTQQLMQVRSYVSMREIMNGAGWRKIVDDYENELEESCPKLEENIVMIEFMVPDDVEQYRGTMGMTSTISTIVKLITFGKIDIELNAIKNRMKGKVHRILMTLAPFQTRKEHRINIASALNYLKRHYRFDYFFYAWGSSLLSTRRFNDEDQSINLSVLMPIVGGPGDGGHPSAATCKPPSNAAWPAHKFSKLNKNNFLDYGNYIASRINQGLGIEIASVRSLTIRDRDIVASK